MNTMLVSAPSWTERSSVTTDGFVRAEASEGVDPGSAITEAFREHALDRVILFTSPNVALDDLGRSLSAALDTEVVGCTTAGEIGTSGYSEGGVVAIGLPSRQFAAETVLIEGLDRLDRADIGRRIGAARRRLAARRPDLPNGFAFLMTDGLSRCEDMLAAALAPSLGGMPLFGGSAGDGARFERAHVLAGGGLFRDAALLTLVQTNLRVDVFSLDNLEPTETRMVVTGADPAARVVREINGAPAAREYARIVGLDPDELDEFAFAAHPVAVRLGAQHHVRAIRRVGRADALEFFSAVDEGMVLSLTRALDIADHLDAALHAMADPEPPVSILACDCFLRRVAAQRDQMARRVGDVLSKHGVVGFSTYGEQVGQIHMNQTLTGIALYPPASPQR